jgi:MoaA/NifB/PqqE/SkfB family radical SAM enzyme
MPAIEKIDVNMERIKIQSIDVMMENDAADHVQSLRPPDYLFLLVTSECNLHCKHCHMWMNEDAPNGLSLPEKLDLVRQFQRLNPSGGVVLCGGEFMLKEQDFFSLTALCRELGLNTAAFTNGSLVEEAHYERLLLEGPDQLFFSLDSHLAAVHDYIRGTEGSCEHILKVLGDLSSLRRERYPEAKVRIYTNTTLFERNLHDIHAFIEHARGLGIDGVRFECLHETVDKRSKVGEDPFFRRGFFSDQNAAVRMFDEIIDRYKNDDFVVVPESDWAWMRFYVANHGTENTYPVCAAFEKIIFVEQSGELLLCPYMHTLKEVRYLGNARNLRLSDFWFSASAEKTRKYMRSCDKECGMISGFRNSALAVPQ